EPAQRQFHSGCSTTAPPRLEPIRRPISWCRLTPVPPKGKERNRTLKTSQLAYMARSQSTPILVALDSFLRDRWNLKPNTLRTYRNAIRRFAKTHRTLAELTPEAVDAYLASVADKKTMAP